MQDVTPALARLHGPDLTDITQFQDFPLVLTRQEQLLTAFAAAPAEGHALEFGVFSGGSLRLLAHRHPQRRFTGFDSFEGLPEPWVRSAQSTYPAGHFGLQDLPTVPANATLVKGFFADTLAGWLASNPGPVAFLHIDADLYSAAALVLRLVGPRLIDGSVLVFDELGNWQPDGPYTAWQEGEWQALCEWLAESGWRFRILSRDTRFAAALQLWRTAPHFGSAQILTVAGRLRTAPGLRSLATSVLAARLEKQPQWQNGRRRLATWLAQDGAAEAALAQIATLRAEAEGSEEYPDVTIAAARCLLRLDRPQEARADLMAHLARTPDDVTALALLGRATLRLKLYEEAASAWGRAYHRSGRDDFRVEAEDARRLTAIRPAFRDMKFSGLMIQHLVDSFDFDSVLDIGSGTGEQAAALRAHGKTVTELDYGKSKYFVARPEGGGTLIGDFMAMDIDATYDCVIASHVLEHQLNVHGFLRRMIACAREDGLIGISVPPAKPAVVGGHVTLWNAGLLMYNLVLAGCDCREAWIRAYGYNISIVVRKRSIVLPEDIAFDSGDVDRLSAFLPPGCTEGFSGDIKSLN